ncbi:hypothetical protein MHK13_08350 [Corynebacterium hadale]|uniref:hypothetical protein n=1 Tax=Corynebacterium hadale TaxID=2026255 RepID=UPI001EF1E37B|nr:hypothetical protein [Corynebacterium hadale]MCG7254743.1 hypothetical protein [Corynebacterium hadale]MCG7257118.1 hypothetical protein [Corynebacterium hadale]MCG7265623.1 hypothetical protein [Corynebacterium hadale]
MTYQRPTDQRRPAQRPPKRPLPPEIYMRRRVVVLVALLVLVGLIVWGLSAVARSGGDGADTASSSVEATASPSPSEEKPKAEPTETVVGEESGTSAASSASETASSESSVAAAPANPGECSLKDLQITATTNQPSYPAGTEPVLYMEVRNPTDVDCNINLDEAKLRFEVYAMGTNERVWADTDCYEPVVGGMQTFAPGATRGFEARWSATGSAPEACENRQPVPAGSYFLHAVIGDNASDPAPFNIT